ncbi:uncharacterized protein V6R79_002043 [Siganus canaliculatus]
MKNLRKWLHKPQKVKMSFDTVDAIKRLTPPGVSLTPRSESDSPRSESDSPRGTWTDPGRMALVQAWYRPCSGSCCRKTESLLADTEIESDPQSPALVRVHVRSVSLLGGSCSAEKQEPETDRASSCSVLPPAGDQQSSRASELGHLYPSLNLWRVKDHGQNKQQLNKKQHRNSDDRWTTGTLVLTGTPAVIQAGGALHARQGTSSSTLQRYCFEAKPS